MSRVELKHGYRIEEHELFLNFPVCDAAEILWWKFFSETDRVVTVERDVLILFSDGLKEIESFKVVKKLHAGVKSLLVLDPPYTGLVCEDCIMLKKKVKVSEAELWGWRGRTRANRDKVDKLELMVEDGLFDAIGVRFLLPYSYDRKGQRFDLRVKVLEQIKEKMDDWGLMIDENNLFENARNYQKVLEEKLKEIGK